MDVVGTTKVRACCTFLWMQDARSTRRVVFTRPYHCAACVDEMLRSAKLQRIAISGSIDMDRVRGALARQREDLLGRWRRQLKAAAEAGFALDPVTLEVLPGLLEATDRALQRRFQSLSAELRPAEAESRKAAMRSSLLGDFLFDAVLESYPEMHAAEQRLLSAALAHGAVEVLVRTALEQEQARRRREAQRLAKLAHELRNAVTAAQLAADLLRRQGALQDGKAARALERSLAQISQGVDDSLLDEALIEGGLRTAPLRLGPVLRDAQAAAGELGAREKNLKVRVQEAAGALRIEADRRIVSPAVRGLLRAAVQLAEPGSTIHVGAAPARRNRHVWISVDLTCKLPGGRVPALPALGFARRAARAHGGSLSARTSPRDGCELRLDFPSIQPH